MTITPLKCYNTRMGLKPPKMKGLLQRTSHENNLNTLSELQHKLVY